MSKAQIEQAVRDSLSHYFKDLKGTEPSDLHDLFISVVEKPLLKEEYQRLQIKAGWPDDQPTKLIFEIGNRMEAPIQCVGATVELKEGRSLNKTFSPKVFVPGKSQRNGSVQDVVKGSMKDYAVLCTCFRQQGQGACVNPLKRNG